QTLLPRCHAACLACRSVQADDVRGRAVLRMRAPKLGDAAAVLRMPRKRGDLGERSEHEGMLELIAWNLQMARAVDDQVAEQDDIDIERAARIALDIAAATIAIFQRVQPAVEILWCP